MKNKKQKKTLQNVFYCFHFSINDAMNVLASLQKHVVDADSGTHANSQQLRLVWGKLEMAKFWKLERTSERKRNNYFPSV